MNAELIAVIDYWVREKGIEKSTLLAAVQNCLAGAAKKALGPTRGLHCEINPKTGAKIKIAASKIPTFKFGKAYKDSF